ncbi:hypothetical protein PLESTB_001471900 [Pleodorina starrii]|uniref:NADP-dependent oxidoreductase domain-containing protein n=1 Tax=Pleodorina starrii TaxID=330485 RepID=A0A9W6BWS6_9CHLO|nr:hypothetical protein PLESTM_000643300 [Pleodorina starrii]GLC59300.1 hypothetical protein PLESTB_001471900 [Pleodorina starrii]GLC74501.1 hypothetical protein PLESTF_001519400 [Pleodorina starrii]
MNFSCKDRALTCGSRARRATPRLVRLCASAAPATAISQSQRVSFKSDPNYTFAPLINGCWQLAGGHGRDVFDNIQTKLEAHAAAGFTTYDTADIYGPSEEILGQFLRSHSAAGGPPVQVFTKYVPNIFQQRPGPAAVEAAIRRSMAKLQVSQLDLVQMHWWEYSIPGMVDTALALTDLQSRGLIRFVGTTNMDVAALEAMEAAGVELAVNQVQFSLLDRRPLNGMLQYCSSRGIKLFTYGSVGGGLLSDKYVEAPRAGGLFGLGGGNKYSPVDLNTSSLKMYWNVAKQFGGQDLWRELLLVLRGVADKHGVSLANVALRWVMQQGDGATVCPIVGLRGTSHIADNARTLAFSLEPQDLQAIEQVLVRAKGPRGDCYSFERGN